MSPVPPIGKFDSFCETGSRVRARRSIYAGHGAGTCSVRFVTRTGNCCSPEIGAICGLRATASAPARCLANVPRKHSDEFVGLFVAVMIASAPSFWFIGAPLVGVLCWLPSRRLVKAAPLAWLGRMSPGALAAAMTGAMVASCIFFIAGRGALEAHQHAAYWTIKLIAIFLALSSSITLTTVWEEWVIWRLSSRPDGTGFFAAALRANLYVLLLVMAVPAVLILPKRLKSPDFYAQRHHTVAIQATSSRP